MMTVFFKRWNNHKQMAMSMGSALFILVIIVIFSQIIHIDDIKMDMTAISHAPSMNHVFGTDWIGRDMFLRTMKGLSGSLAVGVFLPLLH